MIARIQAEQILIISGLTPLVDDRRNVGVSADHLDPSREGRRRSRIQRVRIDGFDVATASIEGKSVPVVARPRPRWPPPKSPLSPAPCTRRWCARGRGETRTLFGA